MGRDWLSRICLNWHKTHHVHTPLQAVLDRYPAVFQLGLGILQGYEVNVYVHPAAVPRFNPACTVPYALQDKVEVKLQCLLDKGSWNQ